MPTFSISGAVWAGDTLYVSGWLDPDIKTHPDTASQTASLLKDIQKFLESQKADARRCDNDARYLGGDPAKEGKMDYAGDDGRIFPVLRHQGSTEQPARTTVQVVLPAGARGGLVEIDLIAVRPK